MWYFFRLEQKNQYSHCKKRRPSGKKYQASIFSGTGIRDIEVKEINESILIEKILEEKKGKQKARIM